jgi:hypothetical protein
MDPETARRILRIITSLFAVLGLLGVLPALMSPMLLDSPQAQHSPIAILMFLCIATFPLVCFCSVLIAWLLFRRGQFSASAWVSALPTINIALGMLLALLLRFH